MSEYKLAVHNVTKIYPGTTALKNFSASFEGGMVHAIIGKNGSGKSTLIKIFSAAIAPTSGKIELDGKEVVMHSPADAFEKGIATVYQELSLIPHLTVAENIYLGRLPKKNILNGIIIDWKKAYKDAKEILLSMNVNIEPDVMVSNLSVGQQQVVEIVKAMSFNPLVLMLDEPTSALARNEVSQLFSLVKRLKEKGVAVLYITHRLHELYDIADTVTVIRDGIFIGREMINNISSERIVDMMFGEVKIKERPKDLVVSNENVLEVKNLTNIPHYENVSFEVKKGEVLGIAGMLGSGRTELLRAIFGVDRYQSGEIYVDGKKLPSNADPSIMKGYGLAMTPENRKEAGLVQILSTRRNITMASMAKYSKSGVIRKDLENTAVEKQVFDLEIKVPDVDGAVSQLSGGNQQKVVVGNWLNNNPSIILFDEPSRGIDVNAKQQIFQIMWDLSRKQISSVFVSTELEELLEVCHRILIMRHGKIELEVSTDTTSIKDLYTICMEEN